MSSPIDQIKASLAEDKLKEGLQAAQALARKLNDRDLQNTLLLLMSRYNGNKKQNIDGLLSGDEFRRESAKLRHALISTLDDIRLPPDFTLDLSAELGRSGEPQTDTQPTVARNMQPPQPQPLPQREEVRILFLTANPSSTARLQLAEEHSRIVDRISNAPDKDKFLLKHIRATTPSKFAESMYEEKPNIVHFSGHGDQDTPELLELVNRSIGRPAISKDTAKPQAGLYLFDEDQRGAQYVGTPFLRHVFRSMVELYDVPIQAVFFNACYSEEQAKAVSKYVPYVIGTTSSVGDQAAIAFATGFYFGLTKGMSIPLAVNFGVGQAMAYNEPEERFILYRKGEQVNPFEQEE